MEAHGVSGAPTSSNIGFKRLGQIYETQVQERNKKPNAQIVPISTKQAIDDKDLQICITAGWVSATSIEDITEEQLVDCVKHLCLRDKNAEDLYFTMEQ